MFPIIIYIIPDFLLSQILRVQAPTKKHRVDKVILQEVFRFPQVKVLLIYQTIQIQIKFDIQLTSQIIISFGKMYPGNTFIVVISQVDSARHFAIISVRLNSENI